MKITYFFRKPYPGAHSIEELFKGIYKNIQQKAPLANISIVKVPAFSKSILGILRNIYYAYLNQSQINHITGDIHYVILALSSKNYNILTIHDCALLYRLPKFSLRYWLFKWLWIRWPVSKANVITTISETTKADIIHFSGCNPNKVIVISNCVNPVFSYLPSDSDYYLPRILQVGTAYNKNLLGVIEALKGVRCILDIIGNLEPEYLSLLKKNNIIYENSSNLTIQEVALHYQKSDLVIFVSTFEGFGMPIIEANQSGRPVITSNLSPMKEVAGNAAHLVDPYNVEEIKKGVFKIINDSDYRKQLIERGLENAKFYDIASVTQQFLMLYSKGCKHF